MMNLKRYLLCTWKMLRKLYITFIGDTRISLALELTSQEFGPREGGIIIALAS